MKLSRIRKRQPASRELLAGALEAYHETFVAPHLRRLDATVVALMLATMVLVAAMIYLIVGG
jgi:hypothetical protein